MLNIANILQYGFPSVVHCKGQKMEPRKLANGEYQLVLSNLANGDYVTIVVK